jgi:hypothetical protein
MPFGRGSAARWRAASRSMARCTVDRVAPNRSPSSVMLCPAAASYGRRVTVQSLPSRMVWRGDPGYEAARQAAVWNARNPIGSPT